MYKYLILVLILYNNVLSNLLEQQEGDPCDWQDRNGTCAHILQCRSAVENIAKKNYPPICDFRAKEPIVCCTDCVLVNDTRKVLYDPNIGELVRTGSRADDECYHYLLSLDYPCKKNIKVTYETKLDSKKNCNHYETRTTIVNQSVKDAQEHKFPHVANLGYGRGLKEVKWLCAGTVISERYVLTAAECVELEGDIGPVKYIALGIYKRYELPCVWQQHNVKRAITHPDYKPSSKYHDIALLETEKEMKFGFNVFPACLDTLSPSVDSKMNTLVWTGGKNSTIDYVTLARFDELECSFFYPPQKTLLNGYNHTIQMCLGDRKKPDDSCDTDTGSPLQSSLKSCAYVVRGIASIPRQCGEAAGSGLFTRVSYYVPWIQSIVWPGELP